MKKSELKELIRTSLLEEEYLEDDPTAMDAMDAAMVQDYEDEEANKYALDSEEPMEEDVIAEADRIVGAWNSKKQLAEQMHGGYLELFEMNPNFEKAIELLDQAWEEWKFGPATEPEDIQMAREDMLAYLSNMLK